MKIDNLFPLLFYALPSLATIGASSYMLMIEAPQGFIGVLSCVWFWGVVLPPLIFAYFYQLIFEP